MAEDTDPGIGIGYPIGSGFPSASTPYIVPQTCVTFDRSLEVLIVGNKAGSYGLKLPENCETYMEAYQREGWIDKLRASAAELKRDLGAPLCSTPIYDELHPLEERIRTRQAPVAYLGRQDFSDWLEVNLAVEGEGKSVEICDSSLGGATIDEIQVSYPDDVLDCYSGVQTLQEPCVTRIVGSCGGGEDGYKLWWPLYQLVKPEVDTTMTDEADNFLSAIKWRTVTLDADAAIEIVGECGCDCCNSEEDFTVTLDDAVEGIVCINSCVTGSLCSCVNRQVRLNYATDFSYGASIDPSLEQAIVLLALTYAANSPVKPCGCDNKMIDKYLEIDPTAANAFAKQLRYGPTVAGMMVMRIVDKALKRPHYNQEVMSGGLLTGRRIRKKGRSPSYQRGF